MTSIKRLSLAALLSLALCAASTPAHSVADAQPVHPFVPGIHEDPDLSRAWQSWQAKGIDDYVIMVRRSCFCPPRRGVRAVIRDNRTALVTRGENRLSAERGWSMDELFIMLREALTDAESVSVDYTPRGIPTSITIDWSTRIADDEDSYSVSLSRLD